MEPPRMCLRFYLARLELLTSARYAREEWHPPVLARVCRCQADVIHTTGSQGSILPHGERSLATRFSLALNRARATQ